jgi:hypothetical protein
MELSECRIVHQSTYIPSKPLELPLNSTGVLVWS